MNLKIRHSAFFHYSVVILAFWAFALMTTVANADTFTPLRPDRTSPIFPDTFNVVCIPVHFLDTYDSTYSDEMFAAATRRDHLPAAFKKYTYNRTWPQMFPAIPPKGVAHAYHDKNPLGYYCKYTEKNLIGYQNRDEGGARVLELRKRALEFTKRMPKNPKYPLPKKVDVYCYMYNTRSDPAQIERFLPELYTKAANGKHDYRKALVEYRKMRLEEYEQRKREAGNPYSVGRYPEIPAQEFLPYFPVMGWRDPLWPSSAPQTFFDGSAMYHELGHVIGAPDFYHAPINKGGLQTCELGGRGAPAYDLYGPTGPLYCRAFHNGVVDAETFYPHLTQSGTYTLNNHASPLSEGIKLGYVIPSSHPLYYYLVEYTSEGMTINVINTRQECFMGSPDNYYTYRTNDPYFLGLNGNHYFPRISKDFTLETNPSCLLPNQCDGGVRIRNIRENKENGTASFDLELTGFRITGKALKTSLLPKIKMDSIKEVMSTSCMVYFPVTFRGEVRYTRYGVCYDTTPKPDIKKSCIYELRQQDIFRARLLDLKPNTTYYVRAFIENPNGLTYSPETLSFKTLPKNTQPSYIAPLLYDHLYTNDIFRGASTSDPESFPPLFAALATYYRTPLSPYMSLKPVNAYNEKESGKVNRIRRKFYEDCQKIKKKYKDTKEGESKIEELRKKMDDDIEKLRGSNNSKLKTKNIFKDAKSVVPKYDEKKEPIQYIDVCLAYEDGLPGERLAAANRLCRLTYYRFNSVTGLNRFVMPNEECDYLPEAVPFATAMGNVRACQYMRIPEAKQDSSLFFEAIRTALSQGRPVPMGVIIPQRNSVEHHLPMQWVLIHGIDKDSNFILYGTTRYVRRNQWINLEKLHKEYYTGIILPNFHFYSRHGLPINTSSKKSSKKQTKDPIEKEKELFDTL